MAIRTLNMLGASAITTSNPSGFDGVSGSQFNLGVDTLTLSPDAVSTEVHVHDLDNYFDDDDMNQYVTDSVNVDGTWIASGTAIEGEYEVFVQDSTGKLYTIQIVQLGWFSGTAAGFVIQGDVPPAGEPLTIVGRADGLHYFDTYDGSAVVCFTTGTAIATPDGPCPVEDLRRGDALCLASGGTTRLELVLSRHASGAMLEDEGRPIRICKGALGPGLPERRLVLSPQHRLHVPALGGLVAAKALTGLQGIGPLRDVAEICYFHLVTAQHEVLLAEGLPCESFWPGPEAMKTLSGEDRARIRAIMGPAPRPALPLLKVARVRRLLEGADAPPALFPTATAIASGILPPEKGRAATSP